MVVIYDDCGVGDDAYYVDGDDGADYVDDGDYVCCDDGGYKDNGRK